MSTSRNAAADAVATVDWLGDVASIAIPVYQRQYRWEISACAQLLEDIRAAADGDERSSHFLGSILCISAGAHPEAGGELVLIDGQQRVTTLMLLIAALRQTVRDADPALADTLARALVHPDDPRRTKLRPHPAWAGAYERAVLAGETAEAARFGENLTYFRSQVGPDEVERVWRGLQRLEHVAITLGPAANAQQIFESLNSTGAPLRDHELIHNYVLMGLGPEDQRRIEADYWVPIERATGDAIGDFFRDYLIARMGHEGLRMERAVYDDFHREFPRLGPDAVEPVVAELREFAEVYGRILDPRRVDDADVARALEAVNEIDSAAYPLVLLAVHDWLHRGAPRERLLTTLRRIQSLWLRRELVGVATVRLAGRLIRAWRIGEQVEADVFGRITPSDLRCRLALRYRELPHADYVLARLGMVGRSGDPAALGAAFVEEWPRDSGVPIDDDDLTPILDAERRPGWYAGWRKEFDYCEYRGEHWEVYDIQHLFRRIFQRLWVERPEELLAFSARHRGPIYPSAAWPGDWAELPVADGEPRHLFQGLAPRFLLAWTQDLLTELGLADEVLVKYAWGMA